MGEELNNGDQEMLGESLEILSQLRPLNRIQKKIIRWQVELMAGNEGRKNALGVGIAVVFLVVLGLALQAQVSPALTWGLIVTGGLTAVYLLLKFMKIL